MAWTFHCDACGMNILADTREALVEKVMRHEKQAHNIQMTREQAEETVEQKGQQEAA